MMIYYTKREKNSIKYSLNYFLSKIVKFHFNYIANAIFSLYSHIFYISIKKNIKVAGKINFSETKWKILSFLYKKSNLKDILHLMKK